MLRSRESRELQLTGLELAVSPEASVNWAHDVWGNVVATAVFPVMAGTMVVDSVARVELDAVAWPVFDIGHTFLPAAPSARHCRASHPHRAASASRFLPRALLAASPPRRPSRHTWPSMRRTSPTTSLAAELGDRRPGVVLPQHPDDLLFAEPASLHLRSLSCGPDSCSPWRRNKASRQCQSTSGSG